VTLVLLVLLVLASMIRRYVVWHNIHAYAGWSIGQTLPGPNAALDEGTLRLPLGNEDHSRISPRYRSRGAVPA
jgi:hypothetical protein